jgi:hypothetical protein
MFSSPSEYIRALRGITGSPTILRTIRDTSTLSDLLATGVKFVPSMNPGEIRSLSKSVSTVAKKFPDLPLNNYLLKCIDKRLVGLGGTAEGGHELVGSMTALSQIIRHVHDGGPPALRPDTVIEFLHSPYWKRDDGVVMDKCELLTVLSRLNIRPFDNLSDGLFFRSSEVTSIRELDRRNVTGRVCGAVTAMAKLDLIARPAFDELLDLLPIGEMSLVEITNAVYAIALAGQAAAHPLVTPILEHLFRRRTELSVASLNQISVTLDALELEGVMNSDWTACISEPGMLHAQNILKSSKAQTVVRRAVDKLGIGHFVKEEFAIGPFAVDLAFPSIRLAIEVNGPYHFYFNSDLPTARTRLKRRILEEKYKYKLIEVSHGELKSAGEKSEFIENKMRTCLSIPFRSNFPLKAELARLART